MITRRIDDYIIQKVFSISQRAILTPANLGIFSKGTTGEVLDVLKQVDINDLAKLNTRKEYDQWYDELVMQFHKELFTSYRDNLIITEDNPYSYSARLLTQYLKYMCTRTIMYCTAPDELIGMIHPIISNKYLNSYPELGFKMVNQIKNRGHYYEIVDHYRVRMDMDLCEQNEAILEMEFGVEV